MTAIANTEYSFNFPIEVQEAFTLGDCWLLAETIHKMTGYPIVTTQWEEPGDSNWSHAGIRLPDKRILDIIGIWSEEEWLHHWHQNDDTYNIPRETRVMFAKEWNLTDWTEELLYLDAGINYPDIAAHVTSHARTMLDTINKNQ